MANPRRFILAALLILALGACAAGSDAAHQAVQGGSVREIVLGFWHGFIAPFTLISEIIEQLAPNILPWSARFYESRDTGVLYDVGFFIGLFAGPSVLWTGASRRR
jgi:hypothetical protein